MRHTVVPSHQWLVVLDIEAGVVGGGRGAGGAYMSRVAVKQVSGVRASVH